MWRVLAVLVLAAPAQDRKKSAVAFTDAEKAGPDYLVQGEYEGEIPNHGKMGAQVVARGDGAFEVWFLGGGLPGAGWDGKTRFKAPAKADGAKVTITGDKWTGEIAAGKITGRTSDGTTAVLSRAVRKSPTEGAKPPEGAAVLFDGTSADEWNKGKLEDGLLRVGAGTGEVTSKRKFRDFKLHLEFRLSFMPYATGQGRSNSGVYMGGRHEVQVLDSFGLTGESNECGGLYGVAKPAVNMCFPPLQWQTYDVEYRMARYDEAGKKVSGARMTVHHNGVKIHDHVELPKTTTAGKAESPEPGPILLQDHGNPLHYRNIWVVELKE